MTLHRHHIALHADRFSVLLAGTIPTYPASNMLKQFIVQGGRDGVLRTTGLTGYLPDFSPDNFPHLVSVMVMYQNLSGTLPKQMFNANKMLSVKLPKNQLSGS